MYSRDEITLYLFLPWFLWLLRSDISFYTCAASGNCTARTKTARGILIASHFDAIAKRSAWNPAHPFCLSISCNVGNVAGVYRIRGDGINFRSLEITPNNRIRTRLLGIPSPISRPLHLHSALFFSSTSNKWLWCIFDEEVMRLKHIDSFYSRYIRSVFFCFRQKFRLFSAVTCLLRGWRRGSFVLIPLKALNAQHTVQILR